MAHDEHEMLVEYSEMTAFNFNSKEYQEVKKDFIEWKMYYKSLFAFWLSKRCVPDVGFQAKHEQITT